MQRNPTESILPFALRAADIRGRIARLDGTLNDVLAQHRYPREVSALVAEAVMLTALIGETIKLRWKLSLQIRGDGPIRIIATDYYAPKAKGEPAKIRGWASFDQTRLSESKKNGFANLGKGMFAMLIDQGQDMTPYQGITPLAGASLSECAATYFAQSEQIPTHFQIRVGETSTGAEPMRWRGGGVMIQHLPKKGEHVESDADVAKAGALLSAADLIAGEITEDWNRCVHLLDSVEEFELIGPRLHPEEVIRRLFHQEEPQKMPPQPIRFGCSCGPEKVEYTMSIYSEKDIAKMTNADGKVTADCQFCGAHYEFDPSELGQKPYAQKHG